MKKRLINDENMSPVKVAETSFASPTKGKLPQVVQEKSSQKENRMSQRRR